MILKNQTIFILGISKFDGAIESTSFTTAKFLAKDNDVYYIDFPYTLKDFTAKKHNTEKAQFRNRRSAFFSRKNCLLHTNVERLKVLIVPPLISTNFLSEGRLYRKLLKLNEHLVVKRVQSVIRRLNIKDFIFINSFNFHYPGVGVKLNPTLSVYHCVDPLISKYDVRHGLVSERQIIEKSDLVICTSKQLFREKFLINVNTVFIPNAADILHCSTALNEQLKVFDDIENIKKPVIGYFGNIERRIDFELLHKVACENQEKSFVFAGPVDDGYVPKSFRSLPNVYFIGKVPYSKMPSVLKGFDVAIIPFKKDEVSATIFPLKLFEYLGAGKPVVSTDFNPDLKEFTDNAVIYCSDYSEFSNALNLLIAQQKPELVKERLLVASQNTWDKRLTELSKLLHAYLVKRKLAV